ncbi:hypothetical protein F5Y15DRAFT_78187 [Xylariaceae sp. FL0016]|nr:hypothetical protein F5Y15DRAFT_78187 [Xylariaceae sp. FL0016]
MSGNPNPEVYPETNDTFVRRSSSRDLMPPTAKDRPTSSQKTRVTTITWPLSPHEHSKAVDSHEQQADASVMRVIDDEGYFLYSPIIDLDADVAHDPPHPATANSACDVSIVARKPATVASVSETTDSVDVSESASVASDAVIAEPASQDEQDSNQIISFDDLGVPLPSPEPRCWRRFSDWTISMIKNRGLLLEIGRTYRRLEMLRADEAEGSHFRIRSEYVMLTRKKTKGLGLSVLPVEDDWSLVDARAVD